MHTAISRGQWQPQTAVSPLLGPTSVAKAVGLMNRENPRLINPQLPRWVQSRLWRVTSKLKQGAHIHQPTAWPLPHACAQPYHAGSGSQGQLFSPYRGSSAWHSRRSVTGESRGESFKCQLHTTHVGAVGWEPHSGSPTTCAGKADHGFGVCVSLALICLLKYRSKLFYSMKNLKSRLYAANFSRYCSSCFCPKLRTSHFA